VAHILARLRERERGMNKRKDPGSKGKWMFLDKNPTRTQTSNIYTLHENVVIRVRKKTRKKNRQPIPNLYIYGSSVSFFCRPTDPTECGKE